MAKKRTWTYKKKNISKALRLAVITRDKNTCQYCGKKGILTNRYGKPCVIEGITNNQVMTDPRTGMKFYTGKDGVVFHIDHINAEFYGGETVINNLILACRKCNLKKGY